MIGKYQIGNIMQGILHQQHVYHTDKYFHPHKTMGVIALHCTNFNGGLAKLPLNEGLNG